MSAHTPILQPLAARHDPREWRQSVEKRLNDLLDRAMSLITALDMMEVDPDLEPWLGAPDMVPRIPGHQTLTWALPDCGDREDDGDDLEPSLGNGGSYGANSMEYDLEAETSSGARVDDEASLGWSAGMNQEIALAESRADYSFYDCEPNGDELDYNGDEGDTDGSECDGRVSSPEGRASKLFRMRNKFRAAEEFAQRMRNEIAREADAGDAGSSQQQQ